MRRSLELIMSGSGLVRSSAFLAIAFVVRSNSVVDWGFWRETITTIVRCRDMGSHKLLHPSPEMKYVASSHTCRIPKTCLVSSEHGEKKKKFSDFQCILTFFFLCFVSFFEYTLELCALYSRRLSVCSDLRKVSAVQWSLVGHKNMCCEFHISQFWRESRTQPISWNIRLVWRDNPLYLEKGKCFRQSTLKSLPKFSRVISSKKPHAPPEMAWVRGPRKTWGMRQGTKQSVFPPPHPHHPTYI